MDYCHFEQHPEKDGSCPGQIKKEKEASNAFVLPEIVTRHSLHK
jgi:hypothetical protein